MSCGHHDGSHCPIRYPLGGWPVLECPVCGLVELMACPRIDCSLACDRIVPFVDRAGNVHARAICAAGHNDGAHTICKSRRKRSKKVKSAARFAAGATGADSCARCGGTSDLQLDHVKALCDGGRDTLQNTSWLCKKCHKAKTREDDLRRAAARAS